MREYLKELREKRQLSQQEVATKINVTRQYYSLIENGDRQQKMDITLIDRLAEAFDVPANQIYLEEETRNKKAREGWEDER